MSGRANVIESHSNVSGCNFLVKIVRKGSVILLWRLCHILELYYSVHVHLNCTQDTVECMPHDQILLHYALGVARLKEPLIITDDSTYCI